MTQVNITIEDIPVTGQGIVAKLVKFQGQLDESNVDEKSKLIYQIIEQNPQNLYLLFDFEELEYMNSKSIGYLTDWYGKITQGNGKLAIAKTRSNILDILQVVGLTQLISCYPTLDEAKFALLRANSTTAPAEPTVSVSPVSPAVSPSSAPVQSSVTETPAPVAPSIAQTAGNEPPTIQQIKLE
ncbi:MAG TPA: STAS domain-containing protein [Candidatus Gracilibacteria bacterium]|nr:STAS domain-containing protein [Candidatus Gracilibacteria bacterium]